MSNFFLSQNLKHLRHLHGYSQEEISLYLNIKRQTYSLYERGIRLPRITLLTQLAALYKTSLDELIGNELSSLIPNQDALWMLKEYNRLPSDLQKEVQQFVEFKAQKPRH